MSLPIADAAMEVGERANVFGTETIGTSYARQSGPAANVLLDLAGPDWYMDPQGVTQIRAWPITRVNTPLTIIDQDGGAGMVTVATEDYVSWLPGCTFTSPLLDAMYFNYGVTYRFDDTGTFRLEVLTQ